MIRSITIAILIALAAAGPEAFAQGGSAIITLIMPPPGGEGYTALQSGAALPQGAASLYYNPALLSDLERSTGSQLFYSRSRQTLLPVLKLKDLTHEFQGFAAVAPDPEGGTDMAIGVFRNHVNFGKNTLTDESGEDVREFNSSETVYGLGTAIRLGIPVSVGGTIKYYESHLADGLDGAEPGIGWAFDLGLLVNPRFLPPGEDFAAASFTPSLGLAMKNLGPDVFYKDPLESDPIPRTYTAAIALTGEALDMIQVVAGIDLDQEWTRRSRNWDPVRTSGFSISFLSYRYGIGWLEDRPGRRDETHISHSLEYNPLRMYRVIRRIESGDFSSPSRDLEKGFPFARSSLWGAPFRFNPRITVGVREIKSHDNGIREGQKAFFAGFSI